MSSSLGEGEVPERTKNWGLWFRELPSKPQVCIANLREPCLQCGMIRRSSTHSTMQWRSTWYDFARALLESLKLDPACTPKKNMCVCVCYSLKLLEKIIMRFLKPSVLQTFPWEMVLLLDLHMLNWCKKEIIKGLGFKQLLWIIWEFEVHYKCLLTMQKVMHLFSSLKGNEAFLAHAVSDLKVASLHSLS